MESDHHEGSINSSEEVKLSEQETDNLGVGRSYECVFCKRGFDTAQALGGHMNIHRKDKARNKPNSNNSFKHEQIYTAGPGLYQQMPSPVSPTNYANNQPANHPFAAHDLDDHHQRHLNYAAYFPGSASGSGPLHGNYIYHHQQYSSDDSDRDHRQPSNPLLPGDWRLSSSFMENLEKNRMQETDPKEDLDLELRLGYDS